MFRRAVQCVIFSGIIMVPGLLFAQPPGRGGPPGGPQGGTRGGPPPEMIFQIFQLADANKDGSVTRAELTAAMQKLARGSQPERGGPPPQRENQADQLRRGQGEQGHQGPPPKPGQVLLEPIAESLNLNERQTRQLTALQADVDKRLAAILTDEQEEQLQNARPPQGPGQGEVEPGERPAGRRPE